MQVSFPSHHEIPIIYLILSFRSWFFGSPYLGAAFCIHWVMCWILKPCLQVMCCDYGFRSGFGRLYQGEDGEIPKNIFQLVSFSHFLHSLTNCASKVILCVNSYSFDHRTGVPLIRYTSVQNFRQQLSNIFCTLKGLSQSALHWPTMNLQGWDNFKKEFQQLRRSFRFNDYAKIAEASPPKGPAAKVIPNLAALKFSLKPTQHWPRLKLILARKLTSISGMEDDFRMISLECFYGPSTSILTYWKRQARWDWHNTNYCSQVLFEACMFGTFWGHVYHRLYFVNVTIF